ncbi:hypothetical protein [Ruegeria sp. HKCCD7255]|uniref:hypothetical protein n=1 Tax=Ruegeria sp. HKCCD7255 TaxID=2683004 RepID=UPI00148987DB|nr:hypothetical protein [Ruegeria sp. HKCCD7255]
MKNETPKDICDEILGLAMEAAGLAVAMDNALFFDNVGLTGLHRETRRAFDGIAKSLRRTTDTLVDQIEALDMSVDWSNAAKDGPRLVNG